MRRILVLACAAGLLAGCGGWQRVGGTERGPSPSETLTQLLDVATYYRKLGRLAAGDPLPFIGSVAAVAGQGDTVQAIVGLSLENRALSFQKDKGGFQARYRVDIAFQPAAGRPVAAGQDEVVRVATFQETFRADESILFQKYFRLAPGSYKVGVTVRDLNSGALNHAETELELPAFGPGTTSAPLLAYQVTARDRAGAPLEAVLNPRGTVAYGGDTLLAYVEAYRLPGPTAVPFEVRTQSDSLVYRDSLRFRGGQEVEAQVLRLRPDSMALGELRLTVGSGPAARSTSAVVSLSTAWVVTNYDEMLSLLRYFGHDDLLSKVRKAAPEDRAAAWRDFWTKTDPNPQTPENEALNRYFSRLAIANTRFRDEGVPGWRTERGEAFILLGEPDDIIDASAAAQGRVIRWSYLTFRLTLYFIDDTGFGRFRMTPASRADFERTVSRLRQQAS